MEFYEELFLEVYVDEVKNKITASQLISREVDELKDKQKEAMESLRGLTNPAIKKQFEDEWQGYDDRLKELLKERTNREKEEVDAKLGFAYARFLIEHLEERLIYSDNVLELTILSLIKDEGELLKHLIIEVRYNLPITPFLGGLSNQ